MSKQLSALRSWGNYPLIQSLKRLFHSADELRDILLTQFSGIAYGNGRSYGDSALAKQHIDTRAYNKIRHFDDKNGIIHVESGLLLSDILEQVVPKGWFLSVTPGTKYITVGGAIASDVHGKNHHIDGCFSASVLEFGLMLATGEQRRLSRQSHADLFHATCAGMGLTGVILDVKLQLKKISSSKIAERSIKTENLKETFSVFEQHSDSPYSVAWIDCLAKGPKLGRSVVKMGDFHSGAGFEYRPKRRLSLSFYWPAFVLNRFTVALFNALYYGKQRKKEQQQLVDIDSFFYPLDGIANWNRLYGKGGFTQYQFILPIETSYDGLSDILTTIAESGRASFLAVLKLYGDENENYLSFPMKGYSLALDFKIDDGLFDFLHTLDALVLKYSGRVYLAKDVRLSRAVFDAGYAKADDFRALRQAHGMCDTFYSLQSKRLEI